MCHVADDRTYQLIPGQWIDIGLTNLGPARAMPIQDGQPPATEVIVRGDDGVVCPDGPTRIDYFDPPDVRS